MGGRETLRRIDKPWGHEVIWAQTDKYVGKVLHIIGGHRLSLQYHQKKDETIYILSGRLRFTVGPSEDNLVIHILGSGERFRIPPGMIHRMEAIVDTDVLEASTPQLDDIVRLEDSYGRA